jgi:hypothetical protein
MIPHFAIELKVALGSWMCSLSRISLQKLSTKSSSFIQCSSQFTRAHIITESGQSSPVICRRFDSARGNLASKLVLEKSTCRRRSLGFLSKTRETMFYSQSARFKWGSTPKLNELFRVKRVRADETIKRAHPLIIMRRLGFRIDERERQRLVGCEMECVIKEIRPQEGQQLALGMGNLDR